MARIRTIKPELFLHETLAELSFQARYLFIGLFTQADRRGRLEDRPKRLKASLLPYDEVDVAALLDGLHESGFIIRYQVDNLRLIQIVSFEKHQRINGDEAKAESKYPAYIQSNHEESTTYDTSNSEEAEKKHERSTQENGNKEGKGKERKGTDKDNDNTHARDLPEVVADSEQSLSKISINEFRFLFQEATGNLMPGGCNQQASDLCRLYPREKIKSAFEITALQGGKTLKYVASVLEGKPKPEAIEARSRDRPTLEEERERILAANAEACREFCGVSE